MNRLKFICAVILYLMTFASAQSQTRLRIHVTDSETEETLTGANVLIEGTLLGAASDENGLSIIQNVQDGKWRLSVTYIGYEPVRVMLNLPQDGQDVIFIKMSQTEEFMEAVHVSSTRSSRTIKDIPTRIEVIAEEELDEKAAMNSANVAMLLRETTGILVQQTSQLSANAGIRIQGLEGRHTLILKDGFPLYDGFGSGLSIMMIPPLDLKQVEVIKGSHSTLYGGGAIAGLVNLISKTPEDNPELSIMVNQTSAMGSTVNGYYAAKSGRSGFTLYSAASMQKAFDPDHDGFSNLPATRSLNLNPSYFLELNESTSIRSSVNLAWDDREGGDMNIWEDPGLFSSLLFEKNRSTRISGLFHLDHQISNSRSISIKASMRHFDRVIDSKTATFQGKQNAGFSELLYAVKEKNREWILGGNFLFDQFDDESIISFASRDFSHQTAGIFFQNLWDAHPKITLETGLRTDWNSPFGVFFLPRLSLLYKMHPNLNSRLGGGFGYQIPTLFIDQAEEQLYQNILALDKQLVKAERSRGIQWDLNWRHVFGDFLGVSLNQLFFVTQLNHMLHLGKESGSPYFKIANAESPALNRGAETNLKLSWQDFSLYANYAYIYSQIDLADGKKQRPLTPRHNFGAALMYEKEEVWRIGLECYYVGSQIRYDGSDTSDFWMAGFMVMREFERLSLFINFENFTNVLQSNYGPTYTPPRETPVFSEIWAPMEGFVANGGFKLKIR